MSKQFYSNCFVEALKHKLKDWKNVKITYVSPRYNEVFSPHFLWSDGKDDYDFGIEKYLKWYERFWFKGEIRKRNLGFNQKWKAYRIAEKQRNAEYDEFFWRKKKMIINRKEVILTKNQAVRWHRRMWNWIAEQIRDGAELDAMDLKKKFMRKHHITFLKNNCFCCDYVIKLTEHYNCFHCPLKWDNYGCTCGEYGEFKDACEEENREKAYRLARKIARLSKKEDKNV